MPTENEVIQNLKKCSHFDRCSANVCVLDLETNLRKRLPEEEQCPFTIKKRDRNQKGIRTQAPAHILEVIPKLNLKMLSRANQKRWYTLRRKDATE